jgi:hydrophobic/amphiphilic exporter-1 (mainly G- bacteria), HAE1 family
MSITEISVKRPLLVTVFFVTLILFGFVSYKQLNYNLLPKFEANVILVQTVYRGASSDEIQNVVTKPIEEAISAIEGIDKISSSSSEGLSLVTVQLKSGINTLDAQRDAERKINQIKSTLPVDADDPVVNRFNTDEIPVLRISASADMSEPELYDLIDQKIKPVLSNVAGVGTVRLIGGNEREIQVNLDNVKLQAYNVSSAQVNQMIANSNSSFPAGSVLSENNRVSIRLDANLVKVEELRNLIIRQNVDGSRILLKDLASITDGQTETKTINRNCEASRCKCC